jgi:hypothetical protein
VIRVDLSGPAKWTRDVPDRRARRQRVQFTGRLADALHDERDRAARRVGVRDSKWNPFAPLPEPDDDELAGASLPGDLWGINPDAHDIGREHFA